MLEIGFIVLFVFLPQFDEQISYGMHDGVEHFETKMVTMNISVGEISYCGYGNASKNSTVCDAVTKNNLTFNEFDWFVEELMKQNFTKAEHGVRVMK